MCSQWARAHPELADQGIDYLDAHADLADMDEPAEHCDTCGMYPDAIHGCACDAPGANKFEAR